MGCSKSFYLVEFYGMSRPTNAENKKFDDSRSLVTLNIEGNITFAGRMSAWVTTHMKAEDLYYRFCTLRFN